jgi:hypothetical protein
MELFPINSQQLLAVVANNFTVDNAATHHVLDACFRRHVGCSEYFHVLEFEPPDPLLLPDGSHK